MAKNQMGEQNERRKMGEKTLSGDTFKLFKYHYYKFSFTNQFTYVLFKANAFLYV
jgi:hypothetical protein